MFPVTGMKRCAVSLRMRFLIHDFPFFRIGSSKQAFRGPALKDGIEERTIEIAQYIVEHEATVRSAAHAFGLSKSTVHKDMEERLKHLHPSLFSQVRAVLSHNKAVRHLRGGEATRRKYRANC